MPANNIFQIRRGTSSQWNSANPVLASGEPGYDLTNNIYKIGDGTSNWNNLKSILDITGNANISGVLSAISGNFNSNLYINNIPVSVSGHNHLSSNITDFNSSVSGLLPSVTGTGYLNTLFNNNTYSISVSGLQPSGNYSLDGHDHIIADVSGLQTVLDNKQPSGIYASGIHSHVSNDITDFAISVSGLLPVKDIVAGSGISVSSISGIYTINSTINSVQEAISATSIITTVFNKTGSTIPKMSVVYINGGQGDQPTVSLAIANGESASSKTYGVTQEAISDMSLGKVVVLGALTGLDTDQFNPTSPHGNINGTTLWLSPTVSGGLTTTKPYAPNHMVAVGTVVRTHQNEGVLEVRIQNGFELEELHNVATTGATNGQFLQYNTSSGLWIPSSTGNFTNLNINGIGVSVSGHAHTTSDITNFNTSVSGLLPSISGSGYVTTSFNDNNYIISVNGLQPSGNYSTVGHTHTYSNITDFNTGVSGLLPSVTGTGYVTSSFNNNTYSISVTGLQPSGNYSLSGHTHTTTDISNFNSGVSGLLPVTNIVGGTNISVVPSGSSFTVSVSGSLGLTTEEVDDRVSSLLVAGTGINLDYNDSGNTLTINTSGLQPSGNYSLSDHTHAQLHDRSHAITSSSDHTATGWRVFYSNNTGTITELALGSSGTVLTSSGSSNAPTFAALPAGGTKTIIRFTPADNQPPSANFATLDTRNSFMVLEFDASTQESANFIGVIPEGASLTNGLIVRIW